MPLPLRQALVEESARFPHVGVVRDWAVLRKIGRIRHTQYVETQRKRYETMVLERDCLIDLADFTSVNIYATDRQGITCAMRIAELRQDRGPTARLFADIAARFGLPLETTLTCSRFVRAQRHNGRHAVDLIRFVRWQAVRAGWRYCVMQTAEKLVPFFRKFDFQETGAWTVDPVAGRLQVLVVDTRMQPLQEGIHA